MNRIDSWLASCGCAFVIACLAAGPGVAQTGQKTPAKQIDHARLVDFINILPKRSDLRVRVAKVGIEQAFAEWTRQR